MRMVLLQLGMYPGGLLMLYKSCLYECQLMHHRYQGNSNHFSYRIFMFYLDIDELSKLDTNLWLIGLNKLRLFSFYDKDHLVFATIKRHLPHKKSKYLTRQNIRQRLEKILIEHGLNFTLGRVMLLTHLRVLGYVFNPVSFYYCYDRSGKLKTVVAEVNNTFGDQKIYVIPFSQKRKLQARQNKLFYISPFIKYDTDLHFYFEEPGKYLKVCIDSVHEGQVILKAVLQGTHQSLKDTKLAWFFLRYPLLTLRIIFLIHFQALKLYLYKIPYYSKSKTDEEIKLRDRKNRF